MNTQHPYPDSVPVLPDIRTGKNFISGEYMISYFSELRYKEVIDLHSGKRLGYVCDAELDDTEGRLVSVITPGKLRFFGLLGREDDCVFPWESIRRMGPDIILVDVEGGISRRKRRRMKL